MTRFTTKGRDPWSHNGRTPRPDLPLERERGPLRFSTIFGIAAALAGLAYFGAQLLRGLFA